MITDAKGQGDKSNLTYHLVYLLTKNSLFPPKISGDFPPSCRFPFNDRNGNGMAV